MHVCAHGGGKRQRSTFTSDNPHLYPLYPPPPLPPLSPPPTPICLCLGLSNTDSRHSIPRSVRLVGLAESADIGHVTRSRPLIGQLSVTGCGAWSNLNQTSSAVPTHDQLPAHRHTSGQTVKSEKREWSETNGKWGGSRCESLLLERHHSQAASCFTGGGREGGIQSERSSVKAKLLSHKRNAKNSPKSKQVLPKWPRQRKVCSAFVSRRCLCSRSITLSWVNRPWANHDRHHYFRCQWRDIRLCLHYWWLINTTELVKSTTTRTFTKYARPCQTEGWHW